MAQTPINSVDIALQALPARLTSSSTNYISLLSSYLEFVYGADNSPTPSTISIKAQLSGILLGTVTFDVTGLKADTPLVLDPNDSNTLLLSPGTFDKYSVTIKAKLTFGGVEYVSSSIVISKRYTSLLTRLTRGYDSVYADGNPDGTNYSLPTADNTLELYNGNSKVTQDVTYGIFGTSDTNITVSGLTLAIHPTTGVFTLSAPSNSWTSDSVTFTLTATFGLSKYSSTYTITKIKQGSYVKLNDPAPTPTGVILTAGFNYVLVECATPDYTTGHGHDKTQVYALAYNSVTDPTPLIGSAKLVAEFKGTVGTFNALPNTVYRVWLKWVTIDGVASVNPWPVTNTSPIAAIPGGYSVTTGVNVDKVVSALTGDGKPFVVLTEDKEIDGVVYQAGTYATQSYIKTAQIGTAQIASAAITNAKIANISADKITTSSLKVGNTISSAGFISGVSGWKISGNGAAEFDAAVIRGTFTADQIDGTGLTIKNKITGEVILDATSSIQDQIRPYGEAIGTSINLDPTCSSITAWNSTYIKTITSGGITGNKVLSDYSGAALIEGITTTKAFKVIFDPAKRYQLSALIRKTGTLVGSGNVHLGLLEFDADGAPRYDWAGFLAKKIPVADLTTNFKRYYAYFGPGDLNSKTVRMAVHVILGYPNTGDPNTLVQMQDIKLEDITLGHNVQYAAVNTSAVDATTKVDYTQNYLEGNMGKDRWVVRRYSVVPTENVIPSYALFTGTAPIQTILVDDSVIATQNFTGQKLFGSYNNYFASATTNVYCETAKTWTVNITCNSAFNILINGNSVYANSAAVVLQQITFNFPAGWSVVEVIWNKLISSDYVIFSSAMASKSQITPGVITEMWALVGGGTPTVTATASAANTAVWDSVTKIPYDKILSNDASTTLGFNPSFEVWQGQYPVNWSNWSGNAPDKEVQDTRFGSYGVKYTITTQNNVGIQHTSSWANAPMPLGTFVAGTVDLKITQKVSGGLPGVLVRLFTNAALNTYVDTKVQANALYNDWQRLAFSARVGITEQIYGIQIFVLGSWDSFIGGAFRGTVIFDGITFGFFDTTIDNKAITVDGVTGILRGTGAVDVVVDNSRVIVGGANLIRNGSLFAAGLTTGWSAFNSNVTLSINSTDVKYGDYNTLQIIGNATGGKVFSNYIMRLKPDTEYTISATVKGNATISSGANKTLYIENWTDEAALNFNQQTILNYDTGVTTSWKQIYQTFKTPASSNLVYCRFYFNPIQNLRLNALFIKLEQGNKVTDWVQSSGEIGDVIDTVSNTLVGKVLKKNESNILAAADGFTIQTPNYGSGTGLLLNAGGIIGKKNGNTTFAIDATTGDASFRGTITASLLQDTDNGNFIIDLANKYISISI